MLNRQDLLDRQIRAVVGEYDALTARRFTIVRLNEPIQRGWRRFFVLTEHAERRKDRDALAAILAVIGTERICRRPDFRTRQRRTRRLIEIEQSIRRVGDREWDRLQLPTNWLKYFRVRHFSEWGRPAFTAEFAYPSLFELRIEPRWVWEIWEPDPAIETRLEELHRWLEMTGGLRRWRWLKGYPQRYRWKDEDTAKQRSLECEHRREIARAHKNFPEVDSAVSTRRIRFSFRRIVFIISPGVAQQKRHSA